MKKHGILNSEIAKILADLGHTDLIVIGDAGLPTPSGVKKIDLALKPGTPSFQEVIEVVSDDMHIEKVYLASEIKENNRSQYEFLKNHFTQDIEFISHEEFKQLTANAKVIIRTGEITPYSNCILQAGVFF
ncbi:D-ribose pyranase [Bacillus andreraoultii]|uniref:D-ribose pyranase n=1 Tax=Bacillus andreraoultii TaxID=1499685 RepID=UPI00053A134B|nr:D-ribose pyranase [Bacillus andreraoultii]